MKILLTANSAWSLANFRTGLLRSLVADGHHVFCAAPADGNEGRLTALGATFVLLPMDPRGTNPVRDLALLARYIRLLQRIRPEAFLTFTIKPTIYGGLAARILGVPTIAVITGLGTAFLRRGWLQWTVRQLYRPALARARRVFFQNRDDEALFRRLGLVREEQAGRMPGSGVDTTHFSPAPLPQTPPVRFLLMGRMLWDKGVAEFVEAARQVRKRHPEVCFQLLGPTDVANPSAIPRSVIDGWVRDGVVEYLGAVADVRPCIAQSQCVVLPSYREGMPRALLEAAAMARPVIATDVPGCRDAVEPGCTGYLIPPKDPAALAAAMEDFLHLSPEERARLGQAGRAKVEQEFDEHAVIAIYRSALADIADPLAR